MEHEAKKAREEGMGEDGRLGEVELLLFFLGGGKVLYYKLTVFVCVLL